MFTNHRHKLHMALMRIPCSSNITLSSFSKSPMPPSACSLTSVKAPRNVTTAGSENDGQLNRLARETQFPVSVASVDGTSFSIPHSPLNRTCTMLELPRTGPPVKPLSRAYEPLVVLHGTNAPMMLALRNHNWIAVVDLESLDVSQLRACTPCLSRPYRGPRLRASNSTLS